jgi:glycosyltransferase involved in cell wall biosynthesis
MNITFLITAGIERPAGTRYFQIARHLVRQGHRVRILALHPDFAGCLQRRFRQDGVDIWYVGQMHAQKSGNIPQRFKPLHLLRVVLRSSAGLTWGCFCSPSDIYHLGKPQPLNGVAALVGILLLRQHHFYVDCDDDETNSNRFTAEWQRNVFAFWQWLLPRLAAGVTVNTRWMAARLERSGIAPVVYVPNGVDPGRFKRPATAILNALRTALGFDGCRLIVYTGTLALQNHPVDLLISAFEQVVQVLPDTRLLLIGGGEDMPILQRQVAALGLQAYVCFTGHIPQHSLPAYLSLASVSVDPVYDNEVARARSPLKIFESMALGVPVVTGAVGDRAELLDDGHAGILVEPGDASSLAQGILIALADETQRMELASACEDYIQSYTWAALAARWKTVYERSGGV